jgi:hypothetical protein
MDKAPPKIVLVRGRVVTCSDYKEPALVLGFDVRSPKGGLVRLAVTVPDDCDMPPHIQTLFLHHSSRCRIGAYEAVSGSPDEAQARDAC